MKDLYVSNGNVKIHVHDYEHAGEAVIFLHFGGANLMMWQRALPYFRDQYRMILPDMRGHGKSDKPESGYHIDELAGDVAAVMAYLKSGTRTYYRLLDGGGGRSQPGYQLSR